MPIYNLNNRRYNIPDEVVNDFERDNPDATIAYNADGNIYDIPVSKKQGFLQKFPNATLHDDLSQTEGQVVNNTISGGVGTQEEADSLFELNAARFNEKDPIKRAALDMQYNQFENSLKEKQNQQLRDHLEESGEIKRLQEVQGKAQLEIDKASFFDRFFNADTRAAVAARDAAEEALETYSEANQKNDGWFDKNVGGVLRGIFDKVGDLRTWDFGASGISSAVALKDVSEKLERGETLTPTEQNMLDAYGLSAAVQAAYQDKVGTAYRVGGSLPESLAFGASLAINPAGGVGKKIAETAAKAALKKYGTGLVSKLAKGAARVGGDIVEMGVATAVPGAGRVAEDYYNRLNGQSTFDIDNNGIIRYGGQMEQEEADDAIWKAFGSQFIENYSEAMGNYFAPMGTMLSNLTSKGLKAGGLGKLAEAVSDISSSQWSKGLQRFKDAVKFDGLVGEYLEEVAGNFMNAATVGDMNFNSPEDPRSVFNPDTNIETFLSCALLSGTMYAVEAPITLYNKYTAKKNLRNADSAASSLLGNRWEDLRNQMDSASPEHLAQILTGVQNAGDLSNEQKQAVKEYASRLMQSQGFNARNVQNAQETTPETAEANNAYNEGSENDAPQYVFKANRERVKAGNALKVVDENVASVIDTALETGESVDVFINSLDENVAPLARDYYNKSLRMRGIIDGVMDRAEDVIAEEEKVIRSVTDPSTGMYTEISRLVTNPQTGEREAQPGYVVGWIGEGENRMPTFLPEGVENIPENRVPLKPTEFDAASIERLPMDEVLSLNAEMIRERAKKDLNDKASMEEQVYNYVPMNQDQVIGADGQVLTITGVTPDGIVYINEQGKPNQMSLDEWKGLMQAQLDAQKAAQAEAAKVEESNQSIVEGLESKPMEDGTGRVMQPKGVQGNEVVYDITDGNGTVLEEGSMDAAEYNGVSEESKVSGQVSDNIGQGADNIGQTSDSVGQERTETPVIPTKEDGSIDFVSYGKEGTFKALGEKYGEKMPNKVAVTAKALADDLAKAKKKLDKAIEDYDNAPIGREEKAEKARDKAQQEFDAIKREADFWAEMDTEIKDAQFRRASMLNPQAETETSSEPMNADEFVAQQLSAGNIVLNKEDYKRETGYGDAEANAMNGGAAKMFGENGMTIQEAGERLMEMDRENGTNFFDQTDSNAGRDALISLLGSVKSRKELNQYIASNRAEQAKKESEGLRNELERSVMDANYASLEDYVLQMEADEMENPFSDVNADEILAIFAEAVEEYNNYLNPQENGQGTTEESIEGNGELLSEEQSGDTGGTEVRQESARNGEGAAEESETEDAATEVELKQEEGETPLQFAERAAKENERRAPLRKRVKEWEKLLGVKVNVIENPGGVRNKEALRYIAKGKNPSGWVESNGEVAIYLPGVSNVDEVDKTIIHEVVAHKGLPGLLGKERFDELCDKVWAMMSEAKRAEYYDYVGDRFGSKEERQRAAADEYMAFLSEEVGLSLEEKTIWDNIVKMFRELLDKALNGIISKSKLTDADIAELIKASYANLKSGAEGGAVGEGTRFSAKKKRALETVSTSRKKHQQTVISSADGAKILNNLDNLAEKYENDTHTKEKTFIGEVAKAIEARKQGSGSQYATFETVNGNVVTIRLADYNATVSNFDNRDENEGISIVVSAKDNNGITNDGDAHIVEYFYDSIDLRRADGKPLAEIVKSIKQSLYSGEYKDTTGLAERQEVNESRFRVVTDKNGKKTLIGLHNISEAKLKKAIKQGGLANPSVAVIDMDKQSHVDYGDITLVLPESMIDKKSGKNIGTYMADAYTPIYPTVVKQMTDKGYKVFNKALDDVNEFFRSKVRSYFNSYLDTGTIYDALYYWYLSDTGKNPPTLEAALPSDFTREEVDKVKSINPEADSFFQLSEEDKQKALVLYAEKFYNGIEAYKEYLADYIRRMQEVVKDESKPAMVRNRIQENLSEIENYGFEYDYVAAYYNRGMLLASRQSKPSDVETFSNARNEVVKKGLNDEFNQWLANKESDLGVEEKLFKGYDNQGRAKYVPNTLENASKLMKKEGRAGATGYGGFNEFVAILAPVAKTTKELNKKKQNLSTKEAYDEFVEQWSGHYHDLAQKLQPGADKWADYGYHRLQEIAPMANPRDYVKREYGIELSEEFMKDLNDIKTAIKNDFPARYFETKFERPVYLNEFVAAVVPSDMGLDLYGQLQRMGIPMYEYERGNNESRMEAVDKVTVDNEGVRFRVANRNQEIFVSNAQTAVEGIKQEKGTPQQWLAMIEKNGGLKAGEDKWLGLSDWLKGLDKKSVTKDEILEFINQNKIRIEEVHYEEGLVGAYKDDFEDAFWTNYVDGTLQNVQIKDEDLAYEWYKEQTGKELKTDENGRLTDRSYRKIEDYANETIVNKKTINSVRMDYTTSGLVNNHEIALTVPTIEPWNENDDIHFGDAGEGRAIAWIRFGETSIEDKNLTEKSKILGSKEWWNMTEEERKSVMNELKELKQNSKPSRVIVIDEIQSKRHQEGRDRGYNEVSFEGYTIGEYKKQGVVDVAPIYSSTGREIAWVTKDKYGYTAETEELLPSGKFATEEEAVESLKGRYKGIPEAPFEKNWHELAMKRMLRYAAENGFDKVAWTTGEQQAERYNIGGVVSSINYFLRGDGAYRVETYGSNGYQINSIPTEFKDAQALADVFGKELATKMVKDLEEDRTNVEEAKKSKKELRDKMRELDDESAEYEALLDEFSKYDAIQSKADEGHVISGEGLRVGGEGMKGFYDKMLPSFVNKYVKKWGTKVKDIELPNVEESGRIMHSVDVTEAMKESVMEGQTMFRISEKGKQIQAEVDKFTSKYNSKPVVLVDSEMTDEKLEEAVPESSANRTREEISSGYPGGYSRDTDKIYIFVNNQELGDLGTTMFHENLHPMYNGSSMVEELYNNAKEDKKALIEALSEAYEESEMPNEMFAHMIAKDMFRGDFKFAEKYLSEESRNELFNTLKEFGYDRVEEESIRRRQGNLRSDITLDKEPQTPGQVDGELQEGKAVSPRERKERLGKLFDQVADMGLEGVLENKAYTSMMVDIYKALPEAVRTEIADDAIRLYGGSVAPAVSDYIGVKSKESIIDKIVTIVREALRKVGFDLDLNANEVRYLAWRSKKPLDRNNLLEVAEDIDMKNRLKVGEYDGTTPDGGGTRFRVANKLQVRDEYEATIKKGGYQAREAVQDAMLSLRKFQELIEKASGKKIRDFENAWMHENRLSSVVQAEIHEMERKFYKPMMDAVKKLMSAANLEQEEVADYLMLKHGIERNREMAVRKALTDDQGKIDRTQLEQWYQEKQNIRNDASLDTWRKKQEAMDNLALMYGADMSRDYSGLTSMFGTDDLADSTQQAYDEVEALETAHPAETESLGKAVKAMAQSSLDKAFESGLMDRKVYNELTNDMYDYYIPLRGFDETTSEEVYAYLDQDRGAFNAPLVRAKGRSSKSDNPIAYLKSIAESGIMQGNRNKMKQSFLNMVMNNPSDLVSVREGVWAIFNPASGEWEAATPPAIPNNATPADVEAAMEAWEQQMEAAALSDPTLVKKVSEAADVPYRVVGNRMNQHQVIVKRLGKSYTLTINGNPRLAMALNGQTNPNNTSNDGKVAAYVSGKIDALNRTLSAWYTTRNPDFVASNFMRDTFYTNTIVRAKEGNAYANKFHKNYAKLLKPGKMINLFRKYENGTLDVSNKTEAAFLDFMMNGGETGYSNLKDLEHIKKQIAKELKGNKLAKLEKVAEKLDILNRAVENTARFAAYLTSRQEGRSIAKSIFDAKEISVNFNKKGAGGTFFGMTGQTKLGNLGAMVGAGGRAFYVFFNAAIQGTTNLMHVMKVNPKGTSAGVAAMFLMGAVVPMLFAGDDDEKDYYDLPEHVRRNHLIIPGTGDAWVSIPLPIEYRIMYGMGELLTSWRTGHERGSDIARKMLNLTGQALPLNFLEEGLDAFIPSALSPIWQVYNNKSWTGLPIYKDTEFNKDDPEYTKAYKNVDRLLYNFSKSMYEWTFDEENQKARVDLNPAVMESLARGYFGGLATQLSNLGKTWETIAGEREFDWRSIPIGNRVFKSGDERTKEKRVTNEYFENMEKLEFLQARERLLKKTINGVEVPEMDKEKAKIDDEIMRGSEVYQKYMEFKKLKKTVDKIRKTIKEKGSTPELEKALSKAQEEANKAVR